MVSGYRFSSPWHGRTLASFFFPVWSEHLNKFANRVIPILPAAVLATVWLLGWCACHTRGYLLRHHYGPARPPEVQFAVPSRFHPLVADISPPRSPLSGHTLVGVGNLRLQLPAGWHVAAERPPSAAHLPTVWLAKAGAVKLEISWMPAPGESEGRGFSRVNVAPFAKIYGASTASIMRRYRTAAGVFAAMARAVPSMLRWAWGPERWRIDTLLMMRSTVLLATRIYRLRTVHLTAYIFEAVRRRPAKALNSADVPRVPAAGGAGLEWRSSRATWAKIFGPHGHFRTGYIGFRAPPRSGLTRRVVALLGSAEIGRRWFSRAVIRRK